ncbi:hypothetical protein Tco_0259656 [Tanacetum coccineum]
MQLMRFVPFILFLISCGHSGALGSLNKPKITVVVSGLKIAVLLTRVALSDEYHHYQKFQLLLCASEISLQSGDHIGYINHAKNASKLSVPDGYLFFVHLLLCRQYVADDNRAFLPGHGCYNDTCIECDLPYGDAELPCQLGSGGGNDSTAGGGVLAIGSLEHPISSLSVDGSLTANGGSSGEGTSLVLKGFMGHFVRISSLVQIMREIEALILLAYSLYQKCKNIRYSCLIDDYLSFVRISSLV